MNTSWCTSSHSVVCPNHSLSAKLIPTVSNSQSLLQIHNLYKTLPLYHIQSWSMCMGLVNCLTLTICDPHRKNNHHVSPGASELYPKLILLSGLHYPGHLTTIGQTHPIPGQCPTYEVGLRMIFSNITFC